MKVALVHDYLNQFGGAERVLLAFTEMFPEAPIYTIFYDENKLHGKLKGKDIHTSFLDHPVVRNNHRFFIPIMPMAAKSLNLKDNYDLIISDSASFGKGISYSRGLHLSYIHAPIRYAWEPETYLGTFLNKFLINLASPSLEYLKNWDRRTAQKPDVILTNSNFMADKLKSFYAREAEVIHPPVDTSIFYPERSVNPEPYFLAFGRLVHFKRFDLIVEAFNELDLKLKIVGSGPEKEKIKSLVKSSNIEMISEVRDENELRKIISNAEGVIFPQLEDFGLVAAESLACGTPVIAYGAGGALEIIDEGLTGTFFHEQSADSIRQAIARFQKMKFDREQISLKATKFSKDLFIKNINRIIKSLPSTAFTE
jgi:glycosyltransferase involved in cell wall biosynthesis